MHFNITHPAIKHPAPAPMPPMFLLPRPPSLSSEPFWRAKPAALLTKIGLFSMCTRHVPELSDMLILASGIATIENMREKKIWKQCGLSVFVTFPLFSPMRISSICFCSATGFGDYKSPQVLTRFAATQHTTLHPLTTLMASFSQLLSEIWWLLFICWTCVLASSSALSLDWPPVSIETASLTLPS